MRTIRFAGVMTLAAALLCGSAMPAEAQQTFNVTLGSMMPFGQDGRVDNDVLAANHEFLSFTFKDFNQATVGAEWLVSAGPFLEFGAGASFYRRTVPTVYRDFVASNNAEIEQSLRFRMIPLAFTVRAVLAGQSSPVQPYVGAGIAIINWRYSEFGDFVDFGSRNLVVRPGTFVANGSEVGPVVLGGVRFGSGALSAGGEVRYQKADAELDSRFAAPMLDLGGWTYQATLGIRFGR